MKSQVMKYREYQGSIEPDAESGMIFGRILFTTSLVMYEGETLSELKRAFENSVDEYLAFCEEEQLQPEKPFSGTFNIRISPELHRKAAFEASSEGCSINEVMKTALTTHFTMKEISERVEDKVAEMEFEKKGIEWEQVVSFGEAESTFSLSEFNQERVKHAH